MVHQANILSQSPTASGKLLLFGVLSSFLGQLCTGNPASHARSFSSIARKWADEVDLEVRSFEVAPPELYWKQAKFYGYVLLCHSTGRRETQDYLEMVEAIILFRTKKQFASDAPERDSLDQPVNQVMASRIDAIVEAVESNLHHLTKCLSLVVHGLPEVLDWKPISISLGKAEVLGCFEAVADHLYSVNLLNGIVLVDGAPLGFLPHSVVGDPLYKRTFGSRTFETVVLGVQHYRSARAVNGVLYEFLQDTKGELHIRELILEKDEVQHYLLLLRKDLLDLPILLRENHSHWYSPRYNEIFVRGEDYQERVITVVVTPNCTYMFPTRLQCSDVESASTQLEECDRLLLGEARVATVLSRIESLDYIHVTTNANSTSLRFLMPRCKLAFEQNDNEVASKEFLGFSIAPKQRLDGTLAGVTSYVILRNAMGSEKVVVPFGTVGHQGSVEVSPEWSCDSGYYTYDVHNRFQNLVASTGESRLHLAAMYAASSSFLVESRHSKSGFVVATGLVRQCWTNGPLTVGERVKLDAVSKHSNLSCTLSLVCSWVFQSSNVVRFLHTEKPLPKIDLDVLAADEYKESAHAQRLLACEERFLLGTEQPLSVTRPLEEPAESSREVQQVKSTEAWLQNAYRRTENRALTENLTSTETFPFKKPQFARGLEEAIFNDLTESWQIHKSLPLKDALIGRESWTSALILTKKDRERAEVDLLSILSNDAGANAAEFKVSLMSGRLEIACPLDTLCMAWDEGSITRFNPFLGPESRMALRVKVVGWMTLCVLEDKLIRLCQTEDKHDLLSELDCMREWSPFQYPHWVAFEVEQQLQIRPYQYTIVQQLLKQPGSCTQLNMGLGKTRVLLPMLILELTRSKCSTVRVTALASIFHEAVDYFRSVLVASVLHVRVCTMPFHRETQMLSLHACILSEQMTWCRENYGCLVVTPQDRNSLLLKQHDNGVFVPGLKQAFADILDESDAILDPSFQLVYANGTQEPLPDGPRRWAMVEALLEILVTTRCKELTGLLTNRHLVKRETSHLGCFPSIRFLDTFRQYEAQAGRAWCEQLVKNPPHEFRWMKEVPKSSREVLVSAMCDATFQMGDHLQSFKEDMFADVLAARGCIAHRTLFHALYSRYRVKYGLDASSGRKMAVPYANSDTPKPRAQYSHPDMAIVYTCLSYYQEGLTPHQFREAVVCLQRLGSVAKAVIFKEWVNVIRADAELEELSKFDCIQKVDSDNKIQLSLMYNHFRWSMPVVSFWMNNFVFPDSTDQFPSRRSTSAWNLTEGGQTRGFSGTDDTRFLLPPDVKQVPPEDPELRSTNGAMIDRILACTHDVVTLEDNGETPLWQEIVSRSLTLGMSALIDAAGLMAGSVNSKVATYMASVLECEAQTSFRGIVYYDVDCNSWTVYELDNKRALSLKSSSLAEAECFVYFDQSRCRGADMKLRKDARSLVTLEPNLPKDKFLQGCMRMRNLREGGQLLILAGTSEFVTRDMGTKEVLEKILQNTVRIVQQGIVTYFERGMTYYSFPKEIKEEVGLKSMYAHALNDHKDLKSFLESSHELGALSSSKQQLVELCKSMGEGVDAQISRLAEECEQELVKEVEQDEEEELQLPVENPYSEIDWPYDKAFSDPGFLFRSKTFCPVKELLDRHVPTLSSVKWSDKMCCTLNFFRAILHSHPDQNLTHYLRPVNTILTLDDGRVVLLSEYEADKLLPLWRDPSCPKHATLQHLCMMVVDAKKRRGFGRDSALLDARVLVSLKLFRGYVHFSLAERKVLSRMFESVQARSIIQNLLCIRGRLRYFDRSDLDGLSSILGHGWLVGKQKKKSRKRAASVLSDVA